MRSILQAGLFAVGALLRQMAVAGLGPVPTADLSTNALDFGSIPVGTSSTPMTVTVSNNGLGPLVVSGVAVGGTNPGDYSVAGDAGSCSAMGSVPAGSSCTVTVTFAPQGLGSSSASITLTDNASTSPQSISLSGVGTSAAAPALSLSAPAIPFGSDGVSVTSAVHFVTLSNSGTAPLTVTGIAIDGANPLDFAIASSTCQAPLAVDASCTVGVTFTAG